MGSRTACALLAALIVTGCGGDDGDDDDAPSTPPPVAPTELVAMDAFLSNLVADDSALYFQAMGGIRTVPLEGGDHVELAATTGEVMTEDDGALWLTRGSSGSGQIIRIDKSDGTGQTIVADQLAPNSIAVDDAHVFWTNESTYQADPPDGSVMMANKDGSDVTELAAGLENPRNVAVDADFVYFTTRIEDGTISRVARDGSGLESIVVDQIWPKALIARDGALYWFNDVDGSSSGGEINPILRHDLATDQTTVLYEDEVRPHDLALDGDELFWTAQNMGDCNTNPDYVDGTVRSIPAAGGAVRTIADKIRSADELVIQGDTLYFAQSLSGCGAIYSLPAR